MLVLPALMAVLVAAPPPPDAPALCALALKNRPLDQLRERSSCTVTETQAFPKGSAMRRAALVEVPLDTGTVEILMIEVARGAAAAWHDLGVVAGDIEDTSPGSSLVIRQQVTRDRFAITATSAGPVLEIASLWKRTLDEGGGNGSDVTRHDVLFCAHDKDLVCLDVPDRWALAVRGTVKDLAPGAWTRAVSLSPAGELVVGEKQGTGELSPFDPGPGTHTFASLAERAFVRRYEIVPLTHPDAEDPLEGLGLPGDAAKP